jgi:hypothetical protein
MHWKRLPIKENYQLIPYICSGTAIDVDAVGHPVNVRSFKEQTDAACPLPR